MNKRVFVLGTVLLVKMMAGAAMSGCDGEVRIKGRLDGVRSSGDSWILSMGEYRFEAESRYNEGYKKGDAVVIEGECGRGVWDYFMGRVWLRDGEVMVIEKAKVKAGLRDDLVKIYQKQLPSEEAGLVAGVVLGYKSGLGQRFYDALVSTGTVHVVVASGYNVVVVGTVIFNLMIYFFRRQKATVVAIVAMVGYGLLAGGEAPVMRAVLMGGLVFVARAVGRQSESGWLLLLAAWSMVMVSIELLESVSFQLSVAATAGLIWIEPRLRENMEKMKGGWMKVALESELVPTLAAQISTGPIIWWHFGRISMVSPIVNVLVLPLVPLIMGLGAIQLVLGKLVAPFSYAVAHLFVVVVKWFG